MHHLWLRALIIGGAIISTFVLLSVLLKSPESPAPGESRRSFSRAGISAPRFEDYGKERLMEYLDACHAVDHVPELVWTFWFGPNEMSQNRHKAFMSVQDRLEVPIILLTDRNVSEFLRWPVSPYVNYLSGIHRADYYRIYFMLHYGGGYTDIKNMGESWKPHFKEFDDPDVWMVGAPEIRGGVAWPPGQEWPGDDYYKKMISNCFMISRQNNQFLAEVHELQNEILDEKGDDLIAHPPPDPGRCCQGIDPQGYPIRWAELLGELMAYVAQDYYMHFRRVLKFPKIGNYI